MVGLKVNVKPAKKCPAKSVQLNPSADRNLLHLEQRILDQDLQPRLLLQLPALLVTLLPYHLPRLLLQLLQHLRVIILLPPQVLRHPLHGIVLQPHLRPPLHGMVLQPQLLLVTALPLQLLRVTPLPRNPLRAILLPLHYPRHLLRVTPLPLLLSRPPVHDILLLLHFRRLEVDKSLMSTNLLHNE